MAGASNQYKRKLERNLNNGPGSKKTTPSPFKSPGQFEDEVTMVYDDGKELYVSKFFLCLISPVFSAMFEGKHKFVENQDKTIKMVGKSYSDVLELLLHVHPRIQKEADESNVYKLVELAEEYMIEGSIARCCRCLMDILKKINAERVNYLKIVTVAKVLLVACRYNYADIREYACKLISEYDSNVTYTYYGRFGEFRETYYARIPNDAKVTLLEMRLKHIKDPMSVCF